jgi:hypothetical protein
LWLVAAVANSILAGKWGAGDSYFATAIAAMCVLSGIFASRTLNRSWTFAQNYLSRWFIRPFQHHASRIGLAGLVIIPLLYIGYGRAVLHMPTTGPVFSSVAQIFNIQPNAQNGFYDSARQPDGNFAGGYADIGHLTTQADIEAGFQLVELIDQVDGPVLSEDAAFNLLAGKDVVTNPTQLLNLANNGLFNGDNLVAMIENQEFDLIILRAAFYPGIVLKAIGESYTPSESETIHMNGFNYIIYRPK